MNNNDERDYDEEAANQAELEEQDHCIHHQHNDRCGGEYGDCDDAASDDCIHCRCCCTCLGCEYGPQDGMLMFPQGNPEIEKLGR
jgi:hypothetical protein